MHIVSLLPLLSDILPVLPFLKLQEGSESLPAETALKNSCNVKLAISKKQSGTCISKETHKKEKT